VVGVVVELVLLTEANLTESSRVKSKQEAEEVSSVSKSAKQCLKFVSSVLRCF
jgi:hypothetical protein